MLRVRVGVGERISAWIKVARYSVVHLLVL